MKNYYDSDITNTVITILKLRTVWYRCDVPKNANTTYGKTELKWLSLETLDFKQSEKISIFWWYDIGSVVVTFLFFLIFEW